MVRRLSAVVALVAVVFGVFVVSNPAFADDDHNQGQYVAPGPPPPVPYDVAPAPPGATITQVSFFYFDSSGAKHVLGNGTQTSTGVWTLTVTPNLAPGTYTLWAQAQDSDGLFGSAAALTLTVQ